jgi:UDP-N-acetylmuramoyl-tripeptide--D-alanyl-D-alanine ligase
MDFFSGILPEIFASFFVQKGSKTLSGISIDTRTLKHGDIFVALKGHQVEGYKFIPQAIEKGASGVVITQEQKNSLSLPDFISIIVVEDPLVFYQKVAHEYLKTKSNLTVIAVTGSSGKTSTKEWIATLLSQRYKVFRSQGNFNTHTGVPLSAFMVKDEQIAVFELGTGKPGDIEVLTKIVAPSIAVVTSIGAAHLEFFGSLENIAKEKFHIFDGVKKGFYSDTITNPPIHSSHVVPVNKNEYFTHIEPLEEKGYKLKLKNGESFLFPFFGEYNLSNLSLAISVTKTLGLTDSEITHTTFSELPSFRSKIVKCHNATVILDCYNANPLSMSESVRTFESFSKPVTLVLGDMLELGSKEKEIHKELGVFLSSLQKITKIIFIGPLMKEAFLSYTKEKIWFENACLAKEAFMNETKKPSFIFIKASRGMTLETLLS